MNSSPCPLLGKEVHMKNGHFSPTNLFLQCYEIVQMHLLARTEDQKGGHWEGQDYFFPQHYQIALASIQQCQNITNYFNYYFHPGRKS